MIDLVIRGGHVVTPHEEGFLDAKGLVFYDPDGIALELYAFPT